MLSVAACGLPSDDTLAYTSGLRCGELVRLTLGDCDLDQRTLLVRGSKGHKSRLVALSDSATAATDRYLASRCGELVRLTLGDCDLDQRTLLVRGSKGHKSRLVALSDSATAATDRYLAARCRFPHGSDAPLLAHGRDGSSPYSVRGIDLGFRRLFRDTGIVGVAGRPARLHDVRHTHAVHALLGWYRQGTDPQAKLPVLAASMGHVSLASTAYYLNLIEPVVRQAGERFADYARTIVAPPQEHSHA